MLIFATYKSTAKVRGDNSALVPGDLVLVKLPDNCSVDGEPTVLGDMIDQLRTELATAKREIERLKALAAERYDDVEALHAELGQPYQSSTVKRLRATVQRWQPVIDAAKLWYRTPDLTVGTAVRELSDAIRDALADGTKVLP